MKWYQPRRTHPIRLEPKPWTGRERRRKRLPEITATVVAKSAYGIKITDDGDWMNWSKVEYRSEPFNTEVQKGDRVQITYAESDSGKVFITTIDKVTGGVASLPPDAGGYKSAAHTGEDFPPDEDPGFGTDATSEPVAPVRREKSTNASIEGQVALKAAIDIAKDEEGNLEKRVGAVIYAFEVFRDAMEK